MGADSLHLIQIFGAAFQRGSRAEIFWRGPNALCQVGRPSTGEGMNLSEYYNTVMELSHGIVITLDEGGG
jgi:hypothetical protein